MIRIIAAVDRKLGIAKHGIQPWYIPLDESYFAEQTMNYGGVVLMGKRTFEIIGRPLPDRRNIVLTETAEKFGDVEIVRDLSVIDSLNDVWVIGGASIFAQMIDKADELYLTHIEADFGCDQFFPEFDTSFQLVREGELREQNGFLFRYCVYKR